MSLTYSQYVTLMAKMLVVSSEAEVNYTTILPSMIEYAENRIYRELDLLTTNTEGSVPCVAGTRSVTVPSSIFIVQSAQLVTPSSTTAAAGKRNPLQRVSLEFMNYVWPTQTSEGVPQFYAMETDTKMLLAPTPDDTYNVACFGPVRPAPLSNSNTTTWITTNIPDLFVAASMVFGAGYQRDFGAQADDPKMAVSWEMQYNTLAKSAAVYEARRKAQSNSWQPYSPAPLARENRT